MHKHGGVLVPLLDGYEYLHANYKKEETHFVDIGLRLLAFLVTTQKVNIMNAQPFR